MNKYLFIAIVVFLSTFPIQAVQAAVKTNNHITVYSDDTGVTSTAIKINGQIRVQLSGTVKATRHAKYLQEGFRNPVSTEGSRAAQNARITAYAYKCAGYYITRLYSDTNATKLIGSVVAYVSEDQLSSAGCAAIEKPTPQKTVTKPTIQPTYPNPTATEEEIKPKVTVPTVNPKYVEPKQPELVPVATEPPKTPEASPDVCGRAEGVTNSQLYGMYPVGSATYDGNVYTNVYAPCEGAQTQEGDLLYITTNSGVGCEGEGVIDMYMDTIKQINAQGTKDGTKNDGYTTYKKTATIPTYENGVSARDNGTGCAFYYDESKLEKDVDMQGNSKYLCESPSVLENGQCLDKTSLETDNFNDCPLEVEECYNEFGGETNVNGSDPLPTCYCPQLGQSDVSAGYTCCLFECPGMDALVSDFKEFMTDDLVGTLDMPDMPDMPEDIESPSLPNIFDVLNGVDEKGKNLEPITTQEDPALETSTFTKDDLKSNADEIEFREDESGGFNIVNPVESLDENLKNPPKPPIDNQQYPSYSEKSSNKTDKAAYPSYNGDKVEQPSYNDKAEIPSYSDKAKVPTSYGR